jgi:hypothetical protein
MKKLFIVGCPRSGTTLVQQALNRHSRIVVPPETAYFSMFLGPMGCCWRMQRLFLKRINSDLGFDLAVPSHRVRTVEQARAFFEEIAAAYLAKSEKKDVQLFVEKTPQHILHLTRIAAVYPDAKILIVYRDGRDVAASLSKVPWGPSNPYAAFRVWLRCYRAQQRAIAHGNADLICVKYEELAANPEKELARITDFLGVCYEPQMAEGAGNRDGVPSREYDWKARAFERITTARTGQWRKELTPRQAQNLERWGGAALRSLGYEVETDPRAGFPLGAYLLAQWRTLTWKTRRLVGVTRSLVRLPRSTVPAKYQSASSHSHLSTGHERLPR